ncbi:hypothetical protein [Devosia sp. 1566]|uniref:hypothetical protein n=1 Tax=Devosia sp. 1566 TaxID=2499144 RepID=UPI000FD8BF0F|nr:hypothetical protein [Devosia sp. 1566]
MQSLGPVALAVTLIASLVPVSRAAELAPLVGMINPQSLPPYPSEAAQQAGLDDLSPALKRCIAVYRLHYALQQQGQGATDDPTIYAPEDGALFLRVASQQAQIPSITAAVAQVAGEIEPILAAYTDRVVENIKAGTPAVDELIAGDLEQCRAVAMALKAS